MTEEERKISYAYGTHVGFISWCWQNKQKPYIVGHHTAITGMLIDEALERFGRGESTFVLNLKPFRHGKSDEGSRFLPPRFLGFFEDEEVIVTSYSQPKASEFGRFGRDIINSKEYQALFPHVKLKTDQNAQNEWSIENHQGKSQYFGLGGGSAGKGGALIVIDDYFASREDAESEPIRNKRWIGFNDDIMTRRAPASIVLINVTPWHVDDIQGRIQAMMEKDPDYPQFDVVRIPAIHDPINVDELCNDGSIEMPKWLIEKIQQYGLRDYSGNKLSKVMYKNGTLFPERFSKKWYVGQKAALGGVKGYGYCSLMQCNPKVRGGNIIKTDTIKIVKDFDEFKYKSNVSLSPQFARAWDLASSEKQTKKDDPDWTVGIKGCVFPLKTEISYLTRYVIYIEDVIRGRWESSKRREKILNAAIDDGNILIGLEAYGPYKDAYTETRDILKGIRIVRKLQLPGDKLSKASALTSIFEAGNVYIKKASWNEAFIKVLGQFPAGAHDDDVDALACLYHMMKNSIFGQRMKTNFI